MKISTLVFDIGNVLLFFDYNRVKKKLNEIEPDLGDKFVNKYYANYSVHRNFECNKISENQFIEINLQWLENKISSNTFREIICDLFTPNNDLINILPELKKHYELILLSNTNYIHEKYLWNKYSFLKIFDEKILSHKVELVKPDSSIYKAVENITSSKPNEIYYTDDIEEYVIAAKRNGWNASQFINNDQLFETLKKLNVLF